MDSQDRDDISDYRMKFREIAPVQLSNEDLDLLIIKHNFNDNDIANALCEMLGK